MTDAFYTTSETLGAAFLAVAERDDVVVRFWNSAEDAPCWTYGELAEGALDVAGALQARGLRRSERVAIVLPTHPDFYRAYFGAILAGGVPVPLYPPVRLGRMDEWKAQTTTMLQVASARIVLTERRLLGLLGGPVRNAAPRLGCHTVAGLMKEGLRGAPILGEAHDLATVQFSSGSTGSPKPVALTHRNMLSNAEAIIDTFPRPLSEQSGVCWLPLYHDMGLVGNLLVAVIGPGDLTLIGPERFVARPRIWLEALSHTRATISVAPNFAFGLCNSRIGPDKLDGLDLSSWRRALCGAEPLQRPTLDEFVERFGTVGFRRESLTPVYGLAEATLAATFSDPHTAPSWTSFDGPALDLHGDVRVSDGGLTFCSLGTPLRGVQLAIRDEQGRDLPEDRLGSIWLRGTSIMSGYLNSPETEAMNVKDGWLDTGDLGFMHDGELYHYGRRKDVIIIRGRNHDPARVEHAVDGVDGIRTGCAAAFGVPDPQAGTESLVVLVESQKETERPLDELSRLATEAIRAATGLNPKQVVIVKPGSLPRTSSGKIRRFEARRRWERGELTPPASAGVALVLKESVKGFANHVRAHIERRRAAI